MDKIYEAAAKYVVLSQYEYRFVLSKSRKCRIVKVNFLHEDFYHLTGLQYIKEIDLPKNRKRIMDDIIFRHKITDSILEKSKTYTNPLQDKDIKSRIDHLRFLEEYLDNDNIIKVFTTRNQQNMSSLINADYIIESQIKGDAVYIFLKQRTEAPDYYCVVSFFKKDNAVYSGEILYWMQKLKILGNGVKIIYQAGCSDR